MDCELTPNMQLLWQCSLVQWAGPFCLFASFEYYHCMDISMILTTTILRLFTMVCLKQVVLMLRSAKLIVSFITLTWGLGWWCFWHVCNPLLAWSELTAGDFSAVMWASPPYAHSFIVCPLTSTSCTVANMVANFCPSSKFHNTECLTCNSKKDAICTVLQHYNKIMPS